MENAIARNKLAFLGVAAALALAAPAASAANPHQAPAGSPFQEWSFNSQVSRASVVDQSLQSSTVGTYLQIDLVTPGTVCGTNNVSIVYILRADHPEQFDNWVRLAQSAYLSGKRLTYSSAKRSSVGGCYTWYLSIRD